MNAFFVERLALELGEEGEYNRIIGKTLYNAFTTDKDTLYLCFEPIIFKISFYQGQAYFQTLDADKLQKKNRLSVYKSAIGSVVTEVKTYPYDRRFDIILEHGEILSFYLYGKFGQITHYQNDTWQETFPVKSSQILARESYEFFIGK